MLTKLKKTMTKERMKNKNHNQTQEERQDRMQMSGVVEESLPGTLFRVKTNEGLSVITTLGGKLRLNCIRILPGDNVVIEVSPYDTSKGRIVWREK